MAMTSKTILTKSGKSDQPVWSFQIIYCIDSVQGSPTSVVVTWLFAYLFSDLDVLTLQSLEEIVTLDYHSR